MAKITENETRGLNTPYAGNSAYNAADSQIQQNIQSKEGIYLANITKCHTEPEKGSTYVDAHPILKMVDANGDVYEAPTYEKFPHYRVQAGIAALIIDPTPGDIGVFAPAKRDISNVTQGNHEPQQPASFRGFSASDSIMIGTIHTKEPTTFIHLRQAENCHWVIPEGVLGETNKTVQWEVGENVIQHIGKNRTETIGQNRSVTIDKNDTLQVKQNQDITITQNQTQTVKQNQTLTVNQNQIQTIDGNQTQTIKGKQDENVTGDVTVTIGANKTLTISGNCTVKINGNADITVQGSTKLKSTGNIDVESSGNIKAKALEITLEATTTKVTGILEVGGIIRAGTTGGAGGISTFNGGLHTTLDVVAGNISTEHHVHMGAAGTEQEGAIVTGEPTMKPEEGEGGETGEPTEPTEGGENG